MAFSVRLAATLLVLCSLLSIAVAKDFTSVYSCTTNYYADGFIYRSNTSSFNSFPAAFSSPLYMAVTSHSDGPLYPIQPANRTGTETFTAFDSFLYINVSANAYEPVGFVEGGNSSLGVGETTWGFYSIYGYLIWYDSNADSGLSSRSLLVRDTVHIQGFEWVDVDGYPGITQLYWNQTQYDLAAAEGSAAGLDASTTNFGLCTGDLNAVITYA